MLINKLLSILFLEGVVRKLQWLQHQNMDYNHYSNLTTYPSNQGLFRNGGIYNFIFSEIVLAINEKLQLNAIFHIALFCFSEIVMIMSSDTVCNHYTRDYQMKVILF